MTEKREDPTPEEIRKTCWEIQDGWSKNEELRRRGYEAGSQPRVEIAGMGTPRDVNVK